MEDLTVHFHRVGAREFRPPMPALQAAPAYLRAFQDLFSAPNAPRRAMRRAAEFGHVVPLAYPVQFQCDSSNRLRYQAEHLPIETQPLEQILGSPMQQSMVVKFQNPWIIQTPPGHSALILPPLNHFHMPFTILAGLVDTDLYYSEVLLPTVCLLRPGQSAQLDAGIPLVQVIPIERIAWRSIVIEGVEISRSTAGADGERTIEFHAVGPERLLAPRPASQSIPEWLKRMPSENSPPDGRTFPTVKRCAPFVDALTSGYVIPLEHELELTMRNSGEISVRAAPGAAGTFETLSVADAPFQGVPILRIRLPWRFKTPAGFSSLILPLLNRFELPLHALAGLIDTDTDRDEILLPLLCTMPPGSRLVLARGTPIAQLIPISRRPAQLEIGIADEQRRQQVIKGLLANHHLYRDAFWQKKSWA